MKVKKLVKKINEACLNRDRATEQKLWLKLLQKSLKGKNTHLVR